MIQNRHISHKIIFSIGFFGGEEKNYEVGLEKING